jgi:hypothetical protein
MFLGDLFGDDDLDKENDGPSSRDVQADRREALLNNMLGKARSIERAAGLVMSIMEKNQQRMQLDDEDRLVIFGTLANYRVRMEDFLQKFANPFTYNSFDTVEVHPKQRMVDDPRKACVQVREQKNMPAYDLFAGYILGLLNDEVTWLEESLGPLRYTLMDLYGLVPSPLTASLSAYLAENYAGEFDFAQDTFTFEGTNGWKWRIGFGNPLTRGYSLAYQKPRQTWWTTMFNDHLEETTGHYSLCGFFEVMEHLSQCPAMLKTARDWECDAILIRNVAKDYPPLAKVLTRNLLESSDYNPYEICTFYDEQVSEEQAETIMHLDELVRQRAAA